MFFFVFSGERSGFKIGLFDFIAYISPENLAAFVLGSLLPHYITHGNETLICVFGPIGVVF